MKNKLRQRNRLTTINTLTEQRTFHSLAKNTHFSHMSMDIKNHKTKKLMLCVRDHRL